jgi:dynein heavy chain
VVHSRAACIALHCIALHCVTAFVVARRYTAQIRALGGLDVPLNIFLFQEIQRVQAVIQRVRATLTALQQALKGEVVLTEALVAASNDVHDARVPHAWAYTLGGAEFSWLLPTLGLWFASLARRQAQYCGWLERGRPVTFWITGFFNPQGFLTGMKQEVARAHRGAESWALDDVVYVGRSRRRRRRRRRCRCCWTARAFARSRSRS